MGFFFGLIAFLVIAFVPSESGTSSHAASHRETVSVNNAADMSNSQIRKNPPRLIDLYSPVEITDINLSVDTKSGRIIAKPEMYNVSDQEIHALRLQITCYDSFGDKVASDGNPMLVNLQDVQAAPGNLIAYSKIIDLSALPDSRMIDIVVMRVAFAYDRFWEKENSSLVEAFKQVRPEGFALKNLVQVAGENVVGYSHVADNFWVCVCGRHNSLAETTCLRCRRAKTVVLQQYCSADLIHAAIERMSAIRNAEWERIAKHAAEANSGRKSKRF